MSKDTSKIGAPASQTRRNALKTVGGALTAFACPEILFPRRAYSADGLTELPIGGLVQASAHAAPMEAVAATDIAEKHGLKINHFQYNAGANLLQALAAGDIVAGVCGCNPSLMIRSQGVKLKILANSNREGSCLVVGPGINTAGDLNGKTVGTPGIASIQEGLMRTFESQHDIKTKHAFVKVTDMPVMLRNGEIAGYMIWETTATAGLEISGGRILATSGQIAADHECCGLVASEKFLNEKPDEALRLVKAFAAGFQLIRSSPEKLASMVSKKDHVNLKIAQDALKHVKYNYPPFNNTKELGRVTSELIGFGTIEKNRVPDIDQFIKEVVDNSLLRKAVA